MITETTMWCNTKPSAPRFAYTSFSSILFVLDGIHQIVPTTEVCATARIVPLATNLLPNEIQKGPNSALQLFINSSARINYKLEL